MKVSAMSLSGCILLGLLTTSLSAAEQETLKKNASHSAKRIEKPKLAFKEKVVFIDDFDEKKAVADPLNPKKKIPDMKIWKLCDPFKVAWAQHFGNASGYENVVIEDGFLKLKASKADGKYKTGGIRTINGFKNNTRVEVCAKLTHKAKGGFPAIWQMPINGAEWPKSGEIDIMEWVQEAPNQIYQTVHTAYTMKSGGTSGHTNPNPDRKFDVTRFHLYAAVRTAEAVIFYVDGKETFRYENKHLESSAGQFPFADLPFDIILNYSLGGELNGQKTWAGKIDDQDLPVEMWVDWVRVADISATLPKTQSSKSKNHPFPQSNFAH